MARRPAPWTLHLVLGLAACVAFALGPLRGDPLLMGVVAFSPVPAIVAGVLMHRPAAKTAWLLLAVGSLLFCAGDLYTYTYPTLSGNAVPFPSPGDALYLGVYPAMMAGLLLMVRRRSSGRDRRGLVDGLVLTFGLALPIWVLLIAPHLHQDQGLLAKAVSIGYPMGDLILLGAVVRLALDGGRREPAFVLLTSSIGLLLAADVVYGLLMLHDAFDHQLWIGGLFISSYVLWGAAALHPSMARLAEPAPARESVLTHFRLVLLFGASLIPPVIAIFVDVVDRDFDSLAIELSALVLFAFVLVRTAGLHARRADARFGALVSQASDLILIVDPQGGVTYSSPSVERTLGRALLDSFASEDDRERLLSAVGSAAPSPFECVLTGADGAPRAFEFRLTGLVDDDGFLLTARDVSARKALEAELTRQAFHDPLTGLPNRPMLLERTRQALARGRREPVTHAMLFLDLDGFKGINDTLGHAVGDEVLVAVARRLDTVVRATDTAARLGGDEFAILLESAGREEAEAAAQRVLSVLSAPLLAGGREIAVHTSVGVALALPDEARTADELIRDADAAMYAAKRGGKGTYHVFEPAKHADVFGSQQAQA
ncbi:GGDEF domain-containing protein [Solirubrobacter taibaiensis]|nr:GGDEF domain-containing protein [Solirubrobacter taibaiensis]